MANERDRVGGKLAEIHARMREEIEGLDRVAVAVYDEETDHLTTYVHSTAGPSPLTHFDARLAEFPSLREVAASGRPRILTHPGAALEPRSEAARRLLDAGIRSSYTLPIRDDGHLYGFLFYDSSDASLFTPSIVNRLWIYSEMIRLLVVHEVEPIRTLAAAVKTAREFSRQRDEETGAHLERMSRFAHLVALALAGRYGLDDEQVELIQHLAPLHDLGKIGVSDAVLLKEGPLDPAEAAAMKEHVAKGLQMVEVMVREFGLGGVAHVEMLRNIVGCHHESPDGSGYPRGLKGEAIPLEARIIKVADVFDALTSERPYKKAWSNQAAFAYLERNAGRLFDAECVEALVGARHEVEAIQARFREQAARPDATRNPA
jgi:HD-GYP domain-containing protein (c-di-GMP phosphodiesterase class II)